jgi:RNA polymerase sigma factor (sigma-70 family)
LSWRRVIDRETLTRLYAAYGPVVYRRALVLLRNQDEAKDAMQEAFVRVVAEHHTFRGEAPVLRWMYRITTNLCLNRIRQRKSHPLVTDPEDILRLVEQKSGDGVDRTTILQIMERLDELTQQIAVYYYLDDMTMDEVGETVGCSRKTVQKKLDGFKKSARAMLEAEPARPRSTP